MVSTQVYPVHIIQQSIFDMQDMKIKFHTTYSNDMVKINDRNLLLFGKYVKLISRRQGCCMSACALGSCVGLTTICLSFAIVNLRNRFPAVFNQVQMMCR